MKIHPDVIIILILLLQACTSTLPPKVFPGETAPQQQATRFDPIIALQREQFAKENALLPRFRFSFAPIQIEKGIDTKITLSDQLERLWLFKADNVITASGAIAIYRIFNLFGLRNPTIHPTEKRINGRSLPGTIQMVIDNDGTLEDVSISNLGSSAKIYLLKSHVLTWLTANHDAAPVNFLVRYDSNREKIIDIVRIDNNHAFLYFGQDSLSENYTMPWEGEKYLHNFYNILWQAYLNGVVDLNLAENYRFVRYVAEFPDAYIDEILRSALLDEIIIKGVLERKHRLTEDFAAFYHRLAAKAGKPLDLEGKHFDPTTEITRIEDYLRSNIATIAHIQSQIDEQTP